MTADLYQELKVPPTATPEEIKKAYRKRARATHPDKGGKTEDFQAVNKAYQVLSDPTLRKNYDETGSTEVESLQEIFDNLVIVAAERVDDPTTQNILKGASALLDEGLSKAHKQLDNLKKEKKKWQEIEKRLHKKKKAPSSLLLKIAQRIKGAEHEMGRAELDIKQGAEMRKMLEEYEYTIELRSTVSLHFPPDWIGSR